MGAAVSRLTDIEEALIDSMGMDDAHRAMRTIRKVGVMKTREIAAGFFARRIHTPDDIFERLPPKVESKARLGAKIEVVVLGEGVQNPALIKASVDGETSLDVGLTLDRQGFVASLEADDRFKVYDLGGMGMNGLELNLEVALAQWNNEHSVFPDAEWTVDEHGYVNRDRRGRR